MQQRARPQVAAASLPRTRLCPSPLRPCTPRRLLVRLVLQEGPFHMHTVAYGVLPLHAAAEGFKARRFKPSPVRVGLDTPQGMRLGDLLLDTQLFSSVRTRSIMVDAVRRMRMLAAAHRSYNIGRASAL